MIGLFIFGMLGLWLWFAIWAVNKLSTYLWRKANTRPSVIVGRKLTTLLLTILVIVLPFIDQLIAYPQWQQLCSTTGDFEWGPNMDEKKVFGREYYGVSETTQFTIFPNIRVQVTSKKILDANSEQLLFTKPHYKYSAQASFYLPSDSGNKAAIFLPTCASYGLNGKNYEKTLNLKWVNKRP